MKNPLKYTLKPISILMITLSIYMSKAQDSVLLPGFENSIYQFKVKDIDGHEFDFSCLEGQKILIVNTGSRCMYRKQLADLQELYEKYKDNGFTIVVFPCNDFYKREPKGNATIKKIYHQKYGIAFPIMSKIHVKGKEIEPIYDFLSYKIKNGKSDNPPKWNFQKYLIDRQGFLYKSINPGKSPLDQEIIDWIKNN
jgi:glutathione peroxidase